MPSVLNMDHISNQPLSLSQILENNETTSLSDSSQLKFSQEKGGIYSNSYKTTGRFASAIAFVARFFLPATKQSFKEANSELANLIQKEYGDEAVASFKTTFASRSTYGSPLTAGSVRRFVSAYTASAKQSPSLSSTNVDALSNSYGKTISSTYESLFLKSGTVKEGTTQEIQDAFENMPPADETKTILSSKVCSLSEIEYHTDPGMLPDITIPSGGYVKFHGAEERGKMMSTLDSARLSASRKDIKLNFLGEAEHAITVATETLQRLQQENAPPSEIEVATQKLPQAQEKKTLLLEETKGYEDWDLEKTACFCCSKGISNTIESFKETIQKKAAALSKIPVEKRADAEAVLATEQRDLDRILNDTEGYQTWSSDKLLAYHELGIVDWNRFELKINGAPISFSNTRNRSQTLDAFKKEISKVTGKEVSDRQAYEMLSLISSEGRPAGFSAGTDPTIGLGLGRDPMGITKECVNLIPSSDGSFNVNYTSGRAYLKGIANCASNDAPPTSFNLTLDRDMNPVDRATTDIPQFEVGIKYTYHYTPPSDDTAKGSVALSVSGEAFWPIEKGAVPNSTSLREL